MSIMKQFEQFIPYPGSDTNHDECLDNILKVLGTSREKFKQMSDAERSAFLRDVKINTILKK